MVLASAAMPAQAGTKKSGKTHGTTAPGAPATTPPTPAAPEPSLADLIAATDPPATKRAPGDITAATDPLLATPAPALAAPQAPAPEPPKFRLQAAVGSGVSTQEETLDNAGLVRFSIAADWTLAGNFRAGLSFGGAFYSARYLTVGPAPDGSPLVRSQVSEQRYDLGAGVSYRWTMANNHLDLEPWLGVRSNLFRNTAVPTNLLGIAPEVLIRVRPSASFAIEVNGGLTYNLLSAPTSNALGKAKSMGNYGVAGRYFFADSYQSVRLGFVGDVLTLERSYRIYDIVEASYALSF